MASGVEIWGGGEGGTKYFGVIRWGAKLLTFHKGVKYFGVIGWGAKLLTFHKGGSTKFLGGYSPILKT